MIEARETNALEGATASFARANGVPGISAGVVIGQELAWSTGIGVGRLDDGSPPDARTPYGIASVTKTFTAVAIVQLRDAGRLTLDDPLGRHVPEFATASDPFGPLELVTLRHLLQHTSGLQGEIPNRDAREWTLLPTAEVVAALGEVSVVVAPGTRFKYSNLGYRLLAEVVRRVSGRPFWDYLREEILEPLEMHATTPKLPPGSVDGHFGRGDEWPVPETPTDDPAKVGEGDGGLWSTVEDLGRWVALHLRADDSNECGPRQVLAGASVQELQRPTFVVDEWKFNRSLGWFSWREGDTSLVYHDGMFGGCSSSVCFDPADRIGAIVLTNRVVRTSELLARELLDTVRPLAPGDPVLDPPTAPPPAWGELLGEYRAPDGWTQGHVTTRGGRLVFAPEPPDSVVRLEATSDPLRFIALDSRAAGETVRFFRDGDGAIDGLNLAGFPLFRLRSSAP